MYYIYYIELWDIARIMDENITKQKNKTFPPFRWGAFKLTGAVVRILKLWWHKKSAASLMENIMRTNPPPLLRRLSVGCIHAHRGQCGAFPDLRRRRSDDRLRPDGREGPHQTPLWFLGMLMCDFGVKNTRGIVEKIMHDWGWLEYTKINKWFVRHASRSSKKTHHHTIPSFSGIVTIFSIPGLEAD